MHAQLALAERAEDVHLPQAVLRECVSGAVRDVLGRRAEHVRHAETVADDPDVAVGPGRREGREQRDRGKDRCQCGYRVRECRQHALFNEHSGNPVFEADNGRRRERGRCGADLATQERHQSLSRHRRCSDQERVRRCTGLLSVGTVDHQRRVGT